MQLGDPQSFNRYAYVSGDPVNFIDPSGLLQILICDVTYVWINDRRVPLMSCSNLEMASRSGPYLGGGAGGGRGGSRTSATSENDDVKDCIERVNREFSKPPRVSDDERNKYNVDMNLAREAYELDLSTAGKQRNNSIYWSFVFGGIGAVAGSKLGGVKGAVAGATIGAGGVVVKDWGAYDISVDAANKRKAMTEKAIREKYPNAYRREFFDDLKEAQIRRCYRLARPQWLRNT